MWVNKPDGDHMRARRRAPRIPAPKQKTKTTRLPKQLPQRNKPDKKTKTRFIYYTRRPIPPPPTRPHHPKNRHKNTHPNRTKNPHHTLHRKPRNKRTPKHQLHAPISQHTPQHTHPNTPTTPHHHQNKKQKNRGAWISIPPRQKNNTRTTKPDNPRNHRRKRL